MIDLYVANNTNYEMNGNMELLPTSCEVDAEINGSWTLSMTHPIDEEGRWKEIIEGAVVKVNSFNGIQLFRIKKVTKQDSGLMAYAEPIFLDSVGDCFNYDVRPTNATGGAALSTILASNNKYSGSSNIPIRATAYYVLKNAMECIAGNEDNSFLNRWGGEIEYNNFQIIINERIGTDNGVELLYGKNIPTDGMRETISIEDVVTRIVPKGFNGRIISSGNQYVNSPLINSYPTIITKVVEFPHIKLRADMQGEADADDIICDNLTQLNAALRSAAAEEFSEGDVDKPRISIECDMILLQNTEEYKDFAALETVSLGDTIHCNHSRLGIKTDARIIALTWDCLTKSVENVKIGSAMPNYLSRVESTIQRTEKAITPEGDVIASQVSGFLNAAKTQLKAQSTAAEPMDVVAILFEDLDTGSPTFGALALGTQGLQVSRTRRNNEWVWGTAITSEGIIANYVVAGILSDKNAINYWNLDTGEFRLSANATVGGQTVQQIATTAANGAVSAQTQQDIFNKLTNNGASQGIYLSNGELYINGTYIKTGAIDANLITAGIIKDSQNKNSWNLNTGKLIATDIEVTGDIKAGSTITGSTISGSTINNGNGTFRVDANGNLTANKATLNGELTTEYTDSNGYRRTRLVNGTLFFHSEDAQGNAEYDTQIGRAGLFVQNRMTASRSEITDGFYIKDDNDTRYRCAFARSQMYISNDSNNGVWITASGNIVVKRNGSVVWSV